MSHYYPFHFPATFLSCTGVDNLRINLSIIQCFSEESSDKKTYLIGNFLDRYKTRNYPTRLKVKEDIQEQFSQLRKAKIIEPKFKIIYAQKNTRLTKKIEVNNMQSAIAIIFYEKIYPV